MAWPGRLATVEGVPTVVELLASGPTYSFEFFPARTDDGERASEAVYERDIRPVSTLVRRSTLEDVFLRLTGRSLVD